MKKFIHVAAFGVLSFLLGAFAGVVVWAVLKLMELGIESLWEWIPAALELEASLPYYLVICIAGGVLIGIIQKKYGLLPDTFEQVLGRIKKEGKYPYDKLPILMVAALLPLIFGGTLGPEAGLSGIIAALCYFVGDRLHYKKEQVSALMETGVAATLGVIFGTPLFGLANNIEPDYREEKYKDKFISKQSRIYVYVMGVAGSFLTFKLMVYKLGGGMGIPRFERVKGFGIEEWMWIIPLILIGVVLGIFYLICFQLTKKLASLFQGRTILRCAVAGAGVAIAGFFFPMSMFSGEHDTIVLMGTWETMSITLLIVAAFVKLFMVNFCVNLGWRGGHIFPTIFAGVTVGYACAILLGMDGTYAVALVSGSIYAFIMKKPITVIAILLIFFPLTYSVPLVVAVLAASKIPQPKALSHVG
ncbi:MAG: chloride channel protein [Lachnospiraceae bacterium]